MVHGSRSPQWCKLLVLYDLFLRGTARFILYMDTDAMFVQHGTSLAQYLGGPRSVARDDPFFRDVRMAPDVGRALLVLTNNALNPWNIKFQHQHKFYTNTGVMFLRHDPANRTLNALARWWNTGDFKAFHFAPVYEQQALNQGLLEWNKRAFAADTFITNDTHFLFAPDSFIVHMTSKDRKVEAQVTAERFLRFWMPPGATEEQLLADLLACCTTGPGAVNLTRLETQISS